MIDWTPAKIERARVLWHKRIPDGRFVYASGEIANALGITRDALAGRLAGAESFEGKTADAAFAKALACVRGWRA